MGGGERGGRGGGATRRGDGGRGKGIGACAMFSCVCVDGWLLIYIASCGCLMALSHVDVGQEMDHVCFFFPPV